MQECTQGFESLSLRQTKQIPIRVSVLFFGIKEEGIRRARRSLAEAKNHSVLSENHHIGVEKISQYVKINICVQGCEAIAQNIQRCFAAYRNILRQ